MTQGAVYCMLILVVYVLRFVSVSNHAVILLMEAESEYHTRHLFLCVSGTTKWEAE